MEKDFDFNAIGKRTPFRTPEAFFEDAKANILKRADEERRKQRRFRLHTGITIALSVAAMICGIVFFLGEPREVPPEPLATEWIALNASDAMDLYVRDLTDEELEGWIEFSENDIFYELTTENLNEDED